MGQKSAIERVDVVPAATLKPVRTKGRHPGTSSALCGGDGVRRKSCDQSSE